MADGLSRLTDQPNNGNHAVSTPLTTSKISLADIYDYVKHIRALTMKVSMTYLGSLIKEYKGKVRVAKESTQNGLLVFFKFS